MANVSASKTSLVPRWYRRPVHPPGVFQTQAAPTLPSSCREPSVQTVSQPLHSLAVSRAAALSSAKMRPGKRRPEAYSCVSAVPPRVVAFARRPVPCPSPRMAMIVCWWCHGGRQTREHPFKECIAWMKEIRQLWEDIANVAGTRGAPARTRPTWKSKRGFGYHVRQAAARPRNTSIRDLLGNDRYREAVLGFLTNKGRGSSRGGSSREGTGRFNLHLFFSISSLSFFPFFPFVRVRLEGARVGTRISFYLSRTSTVLSLVSDYGVAL